MMNIPLWKTCNFICFYFGISNATITSIFTISDRDPYSPDHLTEEERLFVYNSWITADEIQKKILHKDNNKVLTVKKDARSPDTQEQPLRTLETKIGRIIP